MANWEIYEIAQHMTCCRSIKRKIVRRAHELATKGMCPLMAIAEAAKDFGYEVRV